MKGRLVRVGAVALIALSLGAQGCLVPWNKYIALKKKYELLSGEVESKNSQLADDQERITSLNEQIGNSKEQLTSKNQLIQLYKDKEEAARRIADQTKIELTEFQKKLDAIAGRHKDVTAGPGTLTIADKLLFPLGSADISPEGTKVLADIAAEFKGSEVVLRVDGHTDNIPVSKPATVEKFVNNWGLSAMRAATVVTALAKAGMPEKNMYVRAFGMHRSRVANDTPENRAQNRRVEVLFIPPEHLAPKTPEPKK